MEKTDTFNLAFDCPDCGASIGYDKLGLRYCLNGHVLEKIEDRAEPLSPAEYRELSA